ncbi:hypothetical protein [Paenibacillus algorifonticola]|uniref:hypothetical protein n=1 Tax=Paenibacillus algorifonticola TaxID=684063 RepID=UPI00094489AE|nr:hypothetical protein [Paenibacillus algorifonticola]
MLLLISLTFWDRFVVVRFLFFAAWGKRSLRSLLFFIGGQGGGLVCFGLDWMLSRSTGCFWVVYSLLVSFAAWDSVGTLCLGLDGVFNLRFAPVFRWIVSDALYWLAASFFVAVVSPRVVGLVVAFLRMGLLL